MTKKDLNYIAAVEKAVSKKYGQEAIVNPRSGWTKEKEEKYKSQIEETETESSIKREDERYEEVKGVLIHKKLFNKRKRKICSCCEIKIKNLDDDTCYTKYETCFKCYIQHIEGRITRWEEGWRP
tara:strand:+ start:1267 stop:1641 length:375 start_codon:yes stop_codon:yes gene_type:complete